MEAYVTFKQKGTPSFTPEPLYARHVNVVLLLRRKDRATLLALLALSGVFELSYFFSLLYWQTYLKNNFFSRDPILTEHSITGRVGKDSSCYFPPVQNRLLMNIFTLLNSCDTICFGI